eukprot:SAG22_NODE_195_length_15606_cov_21.340878_5_plen_120_part_00
MRTIALLSFLSLWTEMAATCARGSRTEPEPTARGELIAVATSGLARCAALREEKETSVCPGDSVVSGDFLPAVYFIFLPECGGHLYGISGSTVASTGQRSAAENVPLPSIDIIRCAAAA